MTVTVHVDRRFRDVRVLDMIVHVARSICADGVFDMTVRVDRRIFVEVSLRRLSMLTSGYLTAEYFLCVCWQKDLYRGSV